MSFKASSQSNSIQINSLQDLLKNWQDINSSFSILLLEKFNENSTEISTFTEKITSLIEKFVRVSKNINFQASDLKKDSKKKKKMEDFTNKMLNCVLENGKIIMDPSFFEIKSLVGQKIQSVSNILLKINAYGALLNLVLKSECEFGVYKSEISKNFHTFVLNFLICIFTEKNIFQINYFKLIADTLSQNIATNYPTILYKSFKYSLMKSLIYSNRDLSFLEFCEVFLFKLIKENEYYKGVPEHLLGVLQGFFKIMPQEYLLDLHIALKQANYQADINVNIDKLFFLNCGDQIRLKIIESYGVQKPEECVVFFEVLKPLFFNDLLHYKLKSYFSFEKLTEKDHLNLSNELKKALVNFFETSIKKQFELQIQIISKGNFEKNLISNNFEALIQIITSFMLNEQITKELDFELMDFLISLEKTYRALIPLGIWQNTVNIIIKSLFEILVVRNKSQELKFQETFKLFSIVAKDNSIEGLVNLSKFLRILSFASVPSTYKNQIDNFFENDLPQIFEKLIFHKEIALKYMGLLAMEIFSTSDKLENISFLFQKPEILAEFTNFLKNESFEKIENVKIDSGLVNVLDEIFEQKMKKNKRENCFFDDYAEEIGKKKKMEEIYENLKNLMSTMKPKNVDLMRQDILKLFKNYQPNF